MDKCSHCGSTDGIYTKFTGYQYYSWNGKPKGYSDGENEAKYAKCLNCGHRIYMKRILKESKSEQ